MKKLLCVILTLALLPLASVATAEDRSFTFDGVVYLPTGVNLFESPNFTAEDGSREAPQWYVGSNTGTTWDGKAPDPVTRANLTPLEDVVLGGESEAEGKNAFYYSSGNALAPTGNDNFLCEYITDPNGSYWNGNRALQAYVRIDGGRSYYFSYYVSSWGNIANSSVRYGAINSDDFCSEAANGRIVWSGSGGVNVDQYDGNNMTQKRNWAKYESLITADEDADYFFFNLYWLQDTNFVCLNNFNLIPVEPAEAESFEDVSVSTTVGKAPALPSSIGVTFKGGATGSVRAEWEPFEALRDGEYTVGGTAYVGSSEYDVTAKVTVYSDSIDADYSISREITSKNGELTGESKFTPTEATSLLRPWQYMMTVRRSPPLTPRPSFPLKRRRWRSPSPRPSIRVTRPSSLSGTVPPWPLSPKRLPRLLKLLKEDSLCP